MDYPSQSTIKFLQSVAQAQTNLAEFARLLRERPSMKSARVLRFSPTSYLSYFGGELGVTAELKNGSAVDWWIEIRWNEDSWTLKYSVECGAPSEDGTHTEIDFPEIQTTELDVLIRQLNETVNQLMATSSDETIFD